MTFFRKSHDSSKSRKYSLNNINKRTIQNNYEKVYEQVDCLSLRVIFLAFFLIHKRDLQNMHKAAYNLA